MASKYGSSLAEARPDLAAQWSDKNLLTAAQVKPGSSKPFWWAGTCGHEWQAPVDNRVYNNSGCPACSPAGARKLVPGFNDLATKHPELAKQWHPTRNEMGPTEVTSGSKLRVWWLCDVCDREWCSTIKMRAGRGSGCPSCRGRLRGLDTTGPISDPTLLSEWSPRNAYPATHVSAASNIKAWWTCKNGHEWQASIGDRVTKATGCRQCGTGGTSKGEIEVREFVESLGVEVRAHHRQINPRYEYDITVPGKRIAVEYNGLYWHSEETKPRGYHRDKTIAAQEAGWQVIHVWEDDWRDRPEVVKSLLAHKLGKSSARKTNARSLAVDQVTAEQARGFLEANHIQGYARGSVRIGLSSSEGLEAVMIFRSRGAGVWELSRYATASNVRGGFQKLLTFFVRQNSPDKIVSFSDSLVSDGGVYRNSGFSEDGTIPPDYSYLVKGLRQHKFNYRRARFKSDPKLQYRDDLTERDLARLNGLRRIWDGGKTRWVFTPRT